MKLASALLLAGLASGASAVPCSGFGDVDTSSDFCTAIDWIKNRGITLGCATGQYCPKDNVTREQMAAFLNRLGKALEPAFVNNAENGVYNVVNVQGVVCQTPDYVALVYPRTASPVGAMLYYGGPVANDIATKLVYRFPPNTQWFDWSGSIARATNAPGASVSQSPTAPRLNVQPGTTIAFGIRALSGTGAALQTSVAGCELVVRLESRTGSGFPY